VGNFSPVGGFLEITKSMFFPCCFYGSFTHCLVLVVADRGGWIHARIFPPSSVPRVFHLLKDMDLLSTSIVDFGLNWGSILFFLFSLLIWEPR